MQISTSEMLQFLYQLSQEDTIEINSPVIVIDALGKRFEADFTQKRLKPI